jgi:hypothetical protein
MQNKDNATIETIGEPEVTDNNNTETVTDTDQLNNQASEEFMKNLEPTRITETEEDTRIILNKHIEVLPSLFKRLSVKRLMLSQKKSVKTIQK